MSKNYHYYEPRTGHGLPHDPFNAIVGPRPIGWISTQSKDGIVNLAPYSFLMRLTMFRPLLRFRALTIKIPYAMLKKPANSRGI